MDFIFDPGLVLYLPLSELDGAAFMSQDAYGHRGTVTGALWTPRGRDFDGVDDHISIPDAAPLDVTEAITVIAWVKITSVTNNTIIAQKTTSGSWNDGWGLKHESNTLTFWINLYTVNAASIAFTPNDGNWYHIVGTYDRSTIRIYKDTVEGTPDTLTAAITTTATPVEIGSGAGGNSLGGSMGEVLIFNRALSPAETQRHYLATKWRYQ